jgi:hypothetical protein
MIEIRFFFRVREADLLNSSGKPISQNIGYFSHARDAFFVKKKQD